MSHKLTKDDKIKVVAKYLTEYINEGHNQDECIGFVEGFDACLQFIQESQQLETDITIEEDLSDSIKNFFNKISPKNN